MELDGIKTLLELSTREEFLIIRTRGIVLKTDGLELRAGRLRIKPEDKVHFHKTEQKKLFILE